jgi:nitrate reductase delta subunit
VSARALQAAALCLEYPDQRLLDTLPLLRSVAATLPPPGCLNRFLDHVSGTDPRELERDYVETFDLRRRCCLYLTYYTYGDTRKRGMALLRFTAAYRAAGITLVPGELPDHLAVVCEVAARAPEAGLRLLREQRVGVELLRAALASQRSRYVDVLDLIRSVLPEAGPRELDRARQLAMDGPPAEEVGMEPYGPQAVAR